MKYAVKYTRSFRHYNEIDEVVFDFHSGKEDELISAINSTLMQNQRAIINLTNWWDKTIDITAILNKIKKEHNNMAVVIDFLSDKEVFQTLKDNKIPFIVYANNYETFYSAIGLGASDIYVVEELAFDIKNLQFAREKGIQLRMIPDIGQYTRGCKNIIPEPTKFFIRPEDVNTYANYIDVLEIFRQDDRTSVVFEVYHQKQWLGDLKDLLFDFNDTLPNTGINPHFGETRLGCRKKCMVGQCNLCMEIAELAKSFNQVGIEIIKKREKEKIPEEQKEKAIKQLKKKGKEIVES